MPIRASEPLGRVASNAIHHLIATDIAFQIDLELYLCNLIIIYFDSDSETENTQQLVKSMIKRFVMCRGHKDGVPPPKNLTNAYMAAKEARANDDMAKKQTDIFLKVKKDAEWILAEAGSLTDDTERIVTKNLIEGMAKDEDYLDKANDVRLMGHGTDCPGGRCKRCDEFKLLATEDSGEDDASNGHSNDGVSEDRGNKDKLTTMLKTLALMLHKQDKLLGEKDKRKHLVDENKPFTDGAKCQLDKDNLIKLLEPKDKLIKDLTNRLNEQDELVEDQCNRLKVAGYQQEELENRLREQDELVEDQSNRLKKQGDRIERLTDRVDEQGKMVEDLTSRLQEQYELVDDHSNRLTQRKDQIEELTSRANQQDELVEDQSNRLKEHDKMVEDLTNRLEKQNERVEDQSHRLTKREDQIEELINRSNQQDELVEDQSNRLKEQDKMLEDLTNRLQEQEELAENQFKYSQEREDCVDKLINRIKEQDALLKNAVFTDE